MSQLVNRLSSEFLGQFPSYLDFTIALSSDSKTYRYGTFLRLDPLRVRYDLTECQYGEFIWEVLGIARPPPGKRLLDLYRAVKSRQRLQEAMVGFSLGTLFLTPRILPPFQQIPLTSKIEASMSPRFIKDELWKRFLALPSSRIYSLTGRSYHDIVDTNLTSQTYTIRYPSGNDIVVTLEDVNAVYCALYARGELTNDHMEEHCREILRWPRWHAPGSAMFAILPRLDDHIQVTRGKLSV